MRKESYTIYGDVGAQLVDWRIADDGLSKQFNGRKCTTGELLEGLRFKMSGWGVTHGRGRGGLTSHDEIDRV